MFPQPMDAMTVDLSFISLTKVLPLLFGLASEQCWIVALIKPQSEVGRDAIGKGCVVKNKIAIRKAIHMIEQQINQFKDWSIKRLTPSPLKGGLGNEEYFIGAHRYEL